MIHILKPTKSLTRYTYSLMSAKSWKCFPKKLRSFLNKIYNYFFYWQNTTIYYTKYGLGLYFWQNCSLKFFLGEKYSFWNSDGIWVDFFFLATQNLHITILHTYKTHINLSSIHQYNETHPRETERGEGGGGNL